ncbi:SpaA isopeptide-forming pilin-related protein [Eubacterium sp. ER2]|uniref:SpaA isopeptide-forming pilin-related protein n=1 Tax=Eubacterium sp. ER2 TaxID=1519438 RepID=UPI00069147DC|nr:SpaA isopeptide-forming pilin-related protein [Eubacterium sp. ER2]
MKTGKRRILSLVMAVALLVSTAANSVLAADGQESVPADTSWSITVNPSENGSVSVKDNQMSFLAGETVTIISQPADGYETDTVTVTGEATGSDVATTEAEADTYTFQMPDENVQITASYAVAQQDTAVTQEEQTETETTTTVSESEPEETGEEADSSEEKTIGGLSEEEIEALWNQAQQYAGMREASSSEYSGVSTYSVSNNTPEKTVTIIKGDPINYGGWFTHRFTANGRTAYCAEPNVTSPSDGQYAAYKIDNNPLLRTAILLAPGGPLDGKIPGYTNGSIYWDNNPSVVNGNQYQNAHAVIGYIYTGSLAGLSSSYAQGIRTMTGLVTNVMNGTGGGYGQGYGVDLSRYECYIAINGLQDIVWCEENPEGYVNLVKTSANPSITEGNSCYSLAGAVYGVYTDSACTNKVGELRTDAAGNTNTLTLDAGQYYVKEIQAPQGFALDRNTYPVTIQPGQTATVRVRDIPQNDPVNMLLGKYDGEKTYNGEANLPQGSATLAGAEFEVKFYGSMYDTVEDLAGQTPLRSWIFKTNVNGFAYFGEDFLVSGDEFYRDTSGNITLPIGTVTIQEVKAPEGYNINDELFIRQITPSGDAEDVRTYNMPEIKEDVIRGDLEIIKVYQPDDPKDDTLQGIEGVEFTITSKTTGEEVMKIVTDEEGKATTKSDEYPRGSLVFDTYVITETKTPEGYNPIKPFEVTIKDEGVVLTGIYKQDTLITSPIQVVKVDASTGKTIPVAGTTFQLLDENKEVITFTTHYPSEETLDRFTTDENGQFVFPELLRYGSYYLRELEAPEGYILNGEDLQFTVTEEAGWDNPVAVKFADENAMGKIELSKFEEGYSQHLKGAVFEIRAAEDIVTPDGTVRLEKGELADTITTTGEGPVISKELFLGKYILKEIKQPDGFVLSDKEYPVTLQYKDQVTPVVIESETVYNKATTLRIEKYRKGEADISLAGVKFQVWNEKTPDDKQIYTTDDEGSITIKYLLPDSVYCIQEIETLPGYVLDDTIHKVTVDKDGYVEGEQLYTMKLENDYTKYDITKSDLTTGQEVPGAQMEVREKDTGKLIDSWTSTKEPHRITDLVVGRTYVLIEKMAPDGYLVAQDIEFVIPNTGEVQKIDMQDDVVMGQIRIHKTDADNGTGITGAVFEIRAAEDIMTADGTVRLEKGKLADTVTTDKGEAISKELFLGKYTVKEVRQAPGYVLDTTPREVELKYKDQVTPLVYADMSRVNDVTKLLVVKYEKGNKDQPLAGVEFDFWLEQEEDPVDPGFTLDPDMEGLEDPVDPGFSVSPTTLVTDENGEILLTHLQPNTTYYFQETKTLDGYVLDPTIHKIYVAMDGTIMNQKTFTYEVDNDYTKLYVSKTDITTGKELPGAGMKLEKIEEDGSATLIREWISSDQPEYFEKLIPGQYRLTETSAPQGYKVAESISFTVEETGEIQKVVMQDERKEGTIRTSTPDNFHGGARTGDTSDLLLYMVLVLCAAGAVGVTLLVRLARTESRLNTAKKKENTDE